MPPTRSPMPTAFLLMMLYTSTFTCIWACVRYLSPEIHPTVLVFFRTFLGLVFVLPLLLKMDLRLLKSKFMPLHFLRAGLNITAVFGSFYAVSQIPLANAVAISYATPIFTTILAIYILKETAGPLRIFSIIVAFGGVLVLLRPGFITIDLGSIVALIASGFFASSLICAKTLTRHDPALVVTIYGFLLAVPMSLGVALFFWQWPTNDQWLVLLFMGACTGISHFALTKALSLTDITAILPLDFTRLIFATLIGTILFADPVDIYSYIGGGIILLSSVYTAHRERLALKKKALANDPG